MSRLLVLGLSPLPFENQPTVSALNRRTWHVARALQEDGHEILLCCMRVYGGYADEERLPVVLEQRLRPNLDYRALEQEAFLLADCLPRWHQEFQPDAIIAVTPHTAYRAVMLKPQAPLWADLYGYLMGEAQAAAYVHDDDSHLGAWHGQRAILERADVFSACSRRQRYAVIGELGAVGRLSKATAGYDFVRVMPSAIEPEPYERGRSLLRGALVAPNDFVVLFAGGYNTWTDVDTLFDGIERAMRRNRRVRFVSTGGAIKGHDERTFEHFMQRIRGSAFADRFIFVGWVPTADVPSYYLESDVGINSDRLNYETLLGARYRLTDMCKAGLPVITSLGTEISCEIGRAGLGLTFTIGDANGLAEAILRMASEPRLRDSMAQRAARHARENCVYTKALAPLRAWARAPARAPDFDRTAPAAISLPAMPAPRSRLAQLACMIETEGYGRTMKRAATALLKRAARLLHAVGRALVVGAARTALKQRRVDRDRVAAAAPRRVLLLPSDDMAATGRALAQLRQWLPHAEFALWAGTGDFAGASLGGVTRVVPSAGAPPRGLLGQVRLLRAEKPDAVFVVGLGNRGAEVLARLSRGRVFVISDRGDVYESVLAAALSKRTRRGLRG